MSGSPVQADGQADALAEGVLCQKIYQTKELLCAVPAYNAEALQIFWDPAPEKLTQLFDANPVVALDTEYSLETNLSRRQLAYIQMGFPKSQVVCILTHSNHFVGFEPAFFEWLKKDVVVLGFFMHTDLSLLWQSFSKPLPIEKLLYKVFDLYTFFKFLHNGFKHHNALYDWAQRLAGVTLDKKLQKTDWFSMGLGPAHQKYLVEDVTILHQLLGYLQKVSDWYVTNTWTNTHPTYFFTSYKNEQLLIPFLVDITLRGIAVSEGKLAMACEECERRIQQGLSHIGLTLDVYRSSPKFTARLLSDPPNPLTEIIQDWPRTKGDPPYLSRSIKDIKGWLSRYTTDTRFQAAPTLEWFKNFFVVSKYEGIAKFLRGVQKQMSSGKIYPLWDLMGGDTGRITAKNPPLHSTPRDPLARSIIIPSKKQNVFVIADYKTIELVIQAILAKETTMLEIFNTQKDLHTFLAAQVYPEYTYQSLMGLKKTDPSKYKAFRNQMKAVNFGLVYGMGSQTLWEVLLSQGQALPFETADLLHSTWGKTFPKIREYQNRCKQSFHQSQGPLRWPLNGSKYITSLDGHIRRPIMPVDPKRDSYMNLTQIINFPIQATCSEFLKWSLTSLWIYFQQKGIDAQIVLSAHDEIVVECPQEMAPHVEKIMIQIMIRTAQEILGPLSPNAPVEVDTGIGQSWADKP